MEQARRRLKRVRGHSKVMVWFGVMAMIITLTAMPTASPAATVISRPIRGVAAVSIAVAPATASPARHAAPRARRPRVTNVTAELADFTSAPTPSDAHVVTLIHQDFPARAWHDAEAVAWCESKFRTTDIGFDSNGTHDRGVFQLNDGGTEQYLMAMIGQNPKNLNLAFNPALNVRAAALLYARDGWSQWSCQSAI